MEELILNLFKVGVFVNKESHFALFGILQSIAIGMVLCVFLELLLNLILMSQKDGFIELCFWSFHQIFVSLSNDLDIICQNRCGVFLDFGRHFFAFWDKLVYFISKNLVMFVRCMANESLELEITNSHFFLTFDKNCKGVGAHIEELFIDFGFELIHLFTLDFSLENSV